MLYGNCIPTYAINDWYAVVLLMVAEMSKFKSVEK